MGAVFISYRREDAEGQARALSLELVRLLGKESVFMDVDSIALGRDFRQVLQERLGSCDLMIALIGPGWLNAKNGSGTRRVDSPTDFVRQEIAAALQRNIPVIPVFLRGTQVPPPEQLPDDLKDLSYRNGFELGHSTWDSDVRELVKRLGLTAANTADSPSSPSGINKALPDVSARPAWFSWGRPQIAAVIVILVSAAGALIYPRINDGDNPVAELEQPSPGSEETASSPVGLSESMLSPRTAPTTGDGFAGSGIEFLWPGGDCWDIFRGTELVTYKCGAKKQALGPGRYTIKGKHAPLFAPVTVDIKDGSSTRLAMGGVFEYLWPGGDCWDIFRGAELVTYKCGAKKQALGSGRYTIKGKHAPVFAPFEITVTDGGTVVKRP